MTELTFAARFPISIGLLRDGVEAHNSGDYRAGLGLAYSAYNSAAQEGDLNTAGRAARDIASRYDRIGSDSVATGFLREITDGMDDPITELPASTAEDWLGLAVNAHETAFNQDQSPMTLRELGADLMYVAVFAGKRLIQRELNGAKPSNLEWEMPAVTLLTSLKILDEATIRRRQKFELGSLSLDQYTINAIGRAGLVLAAAGKHTEGLMTSASAFTLAGLSESPLIDTSNPDLSPRQRAAAVKKARLRATAGFAANLVLPFAFGGVKRKILTKVKDAL